MRVSDSQPCSHISLRFNTFDLRAGIWLSLVTLTPNNKYRIPSIVMPGLRFKIPVIDLASIFVDSSPKLDFKKNTYVDENVREYFVNHHSMRGAFIFREPRLLSVAMYFRVLSR